MPRLERCDQLADLRWILFAVLGACGRIGFDVPDDAQGPGAIDSASSACARAISIESNSSRRFDICSGSDLLDGCGPPGARELIFAFTAPSSGSYMISARDDTGAVRNSTAIVPPACAAPTTCAGLLGISLSGGETARFIVEAEAGCATITFEVTRSGV